MVQSNKTRINRLLNKIGNFYLAKILQLCLKTLVYIVFDCVHGPNGIRSSILYLPAVLMILLREDTSVSGQRDYGDTINA